VLEWLGTLATWLFSEEFRKLSDDPPSATGTTPN